MRTPEWQQKMQRAAHKSSQRVLERREREREVFDELRNKKHVVDHRKKYQRLKKPGHTLANIQSKLLSLQTALFLKLIGLCLFIGYNNILFLAEIKKKLTRGRKPKNHDAEALLRHKRKHKFRRNSGEFPHLLILHFFLLIIMLPLFLLKAVFNLLSFLQLIHHTHMMMQLLMSFGLKFLGVDIPLQPHLQVMTAPTPLQNGLRH